MDREVALRAHDARLAAATAALLLVGSAGLAGLVARAIGAEPTAVPTRAETSAGTARHDGAGTVRAGNARAGDASGAAGSGGAVPEGSESSDGGSGTPGAAADPVAVAAATLRDTDGRGPGYAASSPVVGATSRPAPPPVPLTAQEYGDPDAVIIRVPDRDYGSGYHGDYGAYRRETSPQDQLRAAATATNGCLIIGDSIATFVVRDLVEDLRRTLGDTCVYDTWPGRATEGTANALLDIKRRAGLPPRIIVMSGTNDIFNPPLFESQMNRLIDGVGPGHQILWVSTFDSRRPASAQSRADEINTAWINRVLAERASRTPQLRIVGWDALFRANARNVDALLSDGVHPNEAGIEAMVRLLRGTLAASPGRH